MGAGDVWAFGAVLAGPPGWLPLSIFGLPSPAKTDNGELEKELCQGVCLSRYDFDGSAYGEEYVTCVKGAAIAFLEHGGSEWALGAIVMPPGLFPAKMFVPSSC